jgi:hypothetical protein
MWKYRKDLVTMTTSQTLSSVAQLDSEAAALSREQNELIQIFAAYGQERADVDARYVARVSALLEHTQLTFERVRMLALEVRPVIVTKGKSAKRLTADHAWRNVTRAVFSGLSDEEFIAAVRASGNRRLTSRFLHKVSKWEINRTALTSPRNAEVVRDELEPLLDGKFSVKTTEEYVCSTPTGFRISTSRPIWPSLEGLPLTDIWNTLLRTES